MQQLEAENPFKDTSVKKHSARTTRLAYNRRIDIEIQPADMETTRFFPHEVSEADLLMQPSWPGMKKVREAGQPVPVTPAPAAGEGQQ